VELGLQKSKEPEPYCWVSILNFHDAVELFLELAAEKLKVAKGVKELRFGEYWGNINPILKNKGKGELTQRIQMDKLNDVRIALKHHGTPPPKSAIEEARINVPNFLEENTKTVFDKNFSEISLVDIVQCQSVKKSLSEAKQFLAEDKKEDAIDKVAVAFEELINDYENRKRDIWGRSPFFFGQDLTFASDQFTNKEVIESIVSLQRAVKIISLGIDYRKYSQFKLITSRALFVRQGGDHLIQRLDRTIESPSKVDIEFCIDFVIESAIILKEFDFAVKPKQRHRH
jgi:hypothetical protein